MKKVVTLTAILAMGLSSFVFAADNDQIPPPKHPVTQDGQPPRHDDKNPDHKGERPNKDGKEWKHDDKSQNHDRKEWKNDDKSQNQDRGQPPKHDGKQPPKDGKKPPLPEENRG